MERNCSRQVDGVSRESYEAVTDVNSGLATPLPERYLPLLAGLEYREVIVRERSGFSPERVRETLLPCFGE